MVQRFRSLPIARWAPLAGRAVFDTARNVVSVLVVIAVGALAGFRFHHGIAPAFAAVGVAVLFGFAMSWLGAFIGLVTRNVETATMGALLLTIPLLFITSLFVPMQTLPGWMQAAAKVNPVTQAVNAARGLSLGGTAVARPVLATAAWTVGLVVVLVPLTIARYQRGPK
jgi:ABC-2 type transport system permease protein/oleandomycin transport system permease protein